MKEMWQLEAELHCGVEARMAKFAEENDLEFDGEDFYTVGYLSKYEFVVDCNNLTPAQVYDLQDLMYSVNEDVDAFISGLYLLDEDSEVDADYFVYRRWITDEEFDELYSILKDYEKLGAQFVYQQFSTRKIYTEVF